MQTERKNSFVRIVAGLCGKKFQNADNHESKKLLNGRSFTEFRSQKNLRNFASKIPFIFNANGWKFLNAVWKPLRKMEKKNKKQKTVGDGSISL